MLSTSNLDSYKINKDQMQELMQMVYENKEAGGGSSTPGAVTKASSEKQTAAGQSFKSAAKSVKSLHKAGKNAKQKVSTAALLHILSEDEIDEPGKSRFLRCPCCPRRSKRPTVDQKTVKVWREKYCKTFEDFSALLSSSTNDARMCIPTFNNIKRDLSYESDPTALGLSSFGGLMWILTYGIQHLIDPTKKAAAQLPKEMISIRATYQEIGAAATKFATIAEQFSTRMDDIHRNAMIIVKHMAKKYKFTKHPLVLRPMYKRKPIHLRKRVGYEPPVIGGAGGGKKDEDADWFHVTWSPLTIVVQYPQREDWEIFSALPVNERLFAYKLFVKHALSLLQNWTRKFTDAVSYTSASSVDVTIQKTGFFRRQSTPVLKPESRTPLFEVTTAMQDFAKSGLTKSAVKKKKSSGDNNLVSASVHDSKDPHDLEYLQSLAEDFWFTMDTVYELSVELERLIHETKEVVKSCYTYATHFYHWKLASFEDFDPKTKTKEYKSNQKQVKATLAKVLGQRRYSDAAMFISLADFTSSIYQKVGQNHQYTTEGYTIKMNTFDDEETETWGLVGISQPK